MFFFPRKKRRYYVHFCTLLAFCSVFLNESVLKRQMNSRNTSPVSDVEKRATPRFKQCEPWWWKPLSLKHRLCLLPFWVRFYLFNSRISQYLSHSTEIHMYLSSDSSFFTNMRAWLVLAHCSLSVLPRPFCFESLGYVEPHLLQRCLS